MVANVELSLIGERYRDVFGANITPSFGEYLGMREGGKASAALGYRRAGDEALFLEAYLEVPVEHVVSETLQRPVARNQIVEIGNFAADQVMAMVELWGAAANDLGAQCEVAVATLTAPLRRMFARIGVPIHIMASARPNDRGADIAAWGRYYESDPMVCCGSIIDGQAAIARFLSRRKRKVAA